MLIDWFTVGAQAFNFLILVGLMKRFLYKPILQAIDAREKLIASELADADAKKAEASKERDLFEHKNQEFDQQHALLLSKATNEAQVERQRLLDEARIAADAASAERQESLKNDARSFNQTLRQLTQQEVFAITRKVLTDLAETSLDQRICDVFIRRLRALNGTTKEGFATDLKAASNPALVRSAFDLPVEQRAAIQNALNEIFSAEIQIRFETAPDLVGGIELSTAGQKVVWSISDYLGSLEKRVNEFFKETVKPESKTNAGSNPEETKPEVTKS